MFLTFHILSFRPLQDIDHPAGPPALGVHECGVVRVVPDFMIAKDSGGPTAGLADHSAFERRLAWRGVTVGVDTAGGVHETPDPDTLSEIRDEHAPGYDRRREPIQSRQYTMLP